MLSNYNLYQAKLYPVLPFLMYQAYKVSKYNPSPPAISEYLTLGSGERKILILGESTVAGVGASQVEFTLAGHLHRLLGEDYELTNLGKNGLRASQVIPHFGDTLNSISAAYEGIFVFLGANDCFRLTHPKTYQKDLKNMLRYLKDRFEVNWIYLADIPPVQLFPAFPSLLKSYLIEQRAFLQEEMKSIAAESDQMVFESITIDLSPDFFSIDKIHPSDIGYQKIAEFAVNGLFKSGILSLNQDF